MKKRFIVTLKNGNTYDMTVEEVDASATVTVDAPAAPAAPKAAPAPQDGVVASVDVKSGDSVKTDQVLLTLK